MNRHQQEVISETNFFLSLLGDKNNKEYEGDSTDFNRFSISHPKKLKKTVLILLKFDDRLLIFNENQSMKNYSLYMLRLYVSVFLHQFP